MTLMRRTGLTVSLSALFPALPFGLGFSRLIYETTPTTFALIGEPAGAALCVLIFASLLYLLLHEYDEALTASLPAQMIWVSILRPPLDVNPLRGLIILIAAALLTLIFRFRRQLANLKSWQIALIVGGLVLSLILPTLQRTVGRADTFEFQVVGPTLGIAHPTGYPLFVLLGKLFSFLPFGKVATRVNLTALIPATLAAVFLFLILTEVLKVRSLFAALGALLFAASPVFWSQAIVAEVYALHNALALAIFGLSLSLVSREGLKLPPWRGEKGEGDDPKVIIILLALLGLSFTNHLTTALLIPAVCGAILLAWPRMRIKYWLLAFALMLVALLLYLYLPVRWAAIQGEPMGWSGFWGWVTGRQFSGSLILSGWLRDPERWRILWRILSQQYGGAAIILSALGLIALSLKNWRAALLVGGTFAAFAFYGLNYYVSDISVFIIPLFWLLALLAVFGIQSLLEELNQALPTNWQRTTEALAVSAIALWVSGLIANGYRSFDWSDELALERWGREVLALPLAEGSAILADSEKIAPLEYLHSVEGIRPDMEMIILGSEAAYIEQLYARLGAGQTVYLARQLPGLEGEFHLRSVGPLVEVSADPLLSEHSSEQMIAHWENGIKLVSADYPPEILVGEEAIVTFTWAAPDQRLNESAEVRLRLRDETDRVIWESAGAVPVNGFYPLPAWKDGELIPDAQTLSFPFNITAGLYKLETALIPPFSAEALPLADGGEWAGLGDIRVSAPRELPALANRGAIRFSEGDLTGFTIPEGALSGGQVTFTANWRAHNAAFQTAETLIEGENTLSWERLPGIALETMPAGDALLWTLRGEGLRCGWLRPVSDSCPLGVTALLGQTVAGALANFDNQILILAADYQPGVYTPGDSVGIEISWQALRQITADYTVFAQLIGPDGRPYGQVDTWPVQGTFPTSTWTPGKTVIDRYWVPVEANAPVGDYQLWLGLYSLSTSARLPLIGPDGTALSDHLTFPGISISP